MRHLLSVALIGLALAGAANDASAQGRGRGGARPGQPGRARGGVVDTARARRMDSLRVARADTLRRRDGADSLRPGRLGPDGRGRGGRPGDMAGRFMLGGISLTEAEKASVKTINQKYAEEFKQLRPANPEPGAGQNAELRAKLQAVTERQRADIRAALTQEHQVQFDANVARGRGRGQPGQPAGPGQPGGRGRRPPPR